MKTTTDIYQIAKLVPPNLQKKFNLARFKLILIVAVWLTIAIYSFIATFLGYKISNLGNASLILALSSQLFTVIYAIPDMGNMRRYVFNKFTLPFWILICLTAHIISFAGSAFYHYMKTSQVSGRPDITTPYQANLLKETQSQILFNTNDYKVFLKSLIAYYKTKKQSSLEGKGPSSVEGRGDRVKLLENIVAELNEELSLANAKFPDDHFSKIVDPNIKLNMFLTLASTISSNVSHPESNIFDLSNSGNNIEKLQVERPLFNFSDADNVISQKDGRALIRSHISKYPFINIKIPYEELGAASGKFKSINEIVKQASLFDKSGDFKPNNAFGLFAATVIEVATFIFNLFFIVQGKNLKSITRRMNRIVVLNNAVDLSRNLISSLTLITKKAHKIDFSFAMLIISTARTEIFKKLDRRKKLFCSEISSKPERNMYIKRLRFLNKLWPKWGMGFDVVYYKLDKDWVTKLFDFGTQTIVDNSFEKISPELLKRTWNVSIISMISHLLNYLLLTGEYQEVNGEYWIDMADFNDWFAMAQDHTGVRGLRIPGLEFDEQVTTWDNLFENLKSTAESAE